MTHLRPDERYSDKKWAPPWVKRQHLARYTWIKSLVKDRVVADAACGTGYGSQMIASSGAKHVWAFDTNEDALSEARAFHSHPLINHVNANICDLPIPNQSIDLFICFETIEHVGDDHGVLREVCRTLRTGGYFVCSTPNRDLFNPGKKIQDRPFNRFHVREYSHAEFYSLLYGYFGHVQMIGQSQYSERYQVILARIGEFFPALATRIHQARKLLGNFLGICPSEEPGLTKQNQTPEILLAICHQPRNL
ncbi:MAG: hypothetical protein RIQ81_1679 [Pseudomonadota bacterium]|jgi:ubiquinone/menaquinone biosynthesis C-methylase UbiE